ncbi:hypothetical protein ACOSP7_013151 [Xanthoceras sorbifolium]
MIKPITSIGKLDKPNYSSRVLGQATQCKTSLEMWLKIEKAYSQQSMAKILQLRQQLQTITKGSDSISDFMLKIKNIGDFLLVIGEEVSLRDLLVCMLNRVRHNYDSFHLNTHIHLLILLLATPTITTKLMEVIEEDILKVTTEETSQEAEEVVDIQANLTNVFTVNFAQSQVMMCCRAIEGLISRKVHKLPFSRIEIRVTHPLEIVYSNIWGPAPILSLDGFRYYIIFVDAYTRFTWLYPLRLKSEAFSKFVHFKKFAELQFNSKIKCFQADIGSE